MHSNLAPYICDCQRPALVRASLGSLRKYAYAFQSLIDVACSVLEMQIIILTLLENFEISLPPQNKNTKIIMLPIAEGEKGIWMGLRIKPVNC